MVKVAVIVNPVAGGSRRPFDRMTVEALIRRTVRDPGSMPNILVTEGPGGGRICAQQALRDGADIVIAWGGDGTVNEVASVLAGSGVVLGIVPVGSGNGLARALGIPRRPAQALAIALSAETRRIDVGLLGDRAFVNVAGFGFDAEIAHRFASAGPRRGFRTYLRLTVSGLLRYAPARYRVWWSGGTFEGEAGLIAFANSRQYGNGAVVAPAAEPDDGWLDMVIVEAASPLANLWRARRLFTGTFHRDPRVQTVRVREAKVAGDGVLRCHVDGEPWSVDGGAVVSIRPGALRVRTGKGVR